MTGNTRALFLMKDAVNRCWVFTDACVVSIIDKLYGHSIIKNSRGVNRKIKKQGNFFLSGMHMKVALCNACTAPLS